MPLLGKLSKYWLTIQRNLFPWLEEELGQLSTNERKLVTTLEMVRLEAFLLNWAGVTGRPPADRVALARSFVTKMIYRINTTKELIDRLRKDKGLRRICGWERMNQVPSESTFSRAFSEFAEERNIKCLIHFTHLDNLENILTFGLIPRKFLEEEVIKVALKPKFSDNQRLDGMGEVNCLSVSFPNYKMFYSKSKDNPNDWAIILFNLDVILKHRCKFTSDNLASRQSKPFDGIKGAEQLFLDSNLRQKLKLPSYYTTNPQSEVLEYSVIPPSWIKEVHVKSEKGLSRVTRLGNPNKISIKVDRTYFKPREDYSYWKTGSPRPL